MSFFLEPRKARLFPIFALFLALSLLLITLMPPLAMAQGKGESPEDLTAQAAQVLQTDEEAQVWYLAEGYTGGDFDTWVLVQNPCTQDAEVTMEFQLPPGASAPPLEFLLPANTRISVHLDELPGLAATDVSTKVSATFPVMVERSVYFNYNGKTGGHDSIGAKYPANVWYLAEGYTGGQFDTWVLVQNPGPADGFVTLEFQLPPGSSAPSYEFELPSGTRKSIHLDDLPGLSGTDVSTKVCATIPVVAERAMYFDYYGRTGGHDSLGVDYPSKNWYLAEGYTGGQFDTWVLVQNPGDEDATVTLNFQLPPGTSASPYAFALPARTRKTVHLDDLPGLANTDVSTTVESDKPVVAERAMYFDYEGKNDGHDSSGAVSPSPFWFLAEGYTGGQFDTWVLVQNPGKTDKHVTLEFQLTPGSSANPYEFDLPAGTRKSVHLDDLPGLSNTDVSTLVSADGPVVAERAMYFNYEGKDGGSCSIGALFEPPMVRETTNILGPDDLKHLVEKVPNGDYLEMTFDADTAVLQKVDVGDVIASGVTSQTPNGMLQKVVSVYRGGGQVVLNTATASFEEAVWRGRLTSSTPLDPSQVASTRILDPSVQYLGGGSPASDPADPDSFSSAIDSPRLGFDYNIQNLQLGEGANNIQITTGSIGLGIFATFDIDVDITWPGVDWTVTRHTFKKTVWGVEIDTGIPYWTVDFDVTPPSVSLNTMSFSVTFEENVNIQATANFNASVSYEKELVEHSFTPITVVVGVPPFAVPVVLVPYINLHAGIEGSAGGSVSFGVFQRGSLSAGVQYSNGNFTPTGDRTFNCEWTPPTGSLNADFRIYAGPQFALKLYDICGPYANVEPFVRIVINTSQPPLWSVYVGVDLDLGVKAEVEIEVGFDVPYIGWKSWSWTKTLFDVGWNPLKRLEALLACEVKIDRIEADSGPVGAGVTILGSGFGDGRENNSYVTFGSVPVTEYTGWTPGAIGCMVPVGVAQGAQEVKVVHVFHDWTTINPLFIIKVESNTKTFTVTGGGGGGGGGAELLTNGDFAQGATGWQVWSQGGSQHYGYNNTEIIGSGPTAYLHVYRSCPEKDGGGTGLIQGLNAQPGGGLYLSSSVRCDYQRGGAIAGSDPDWYPEGAAQFRIVYRRPDGSIGEWYHGFNYDSVPGADLAHFTQVAQGSWIYYQSPNILDEIGAGATILELRIYGFGWDFDGSADNLSLRST